MKKLSQIASWLALVLISSFALQSCEFDNNEKNYVNVEPPKDIMIAIDLSGVKPDEVIQVVNHSDVYFTLSAEGKEHLLQEFYWDGQQIMSESGYSYVRISRPNVDNDIHELKLKMAFKTGSGSLADVSKMEYYLGEFTFKVKLIENPTQNLNFTQTVDANKNLKIMWQNPNNAEVEKYEIYDDYYTSNEHLLATITNVENPFYVDPDYVYGYKLYTVKTIFKNSTMKYNENTFVPRYESLTTDNVKAEAIEGNKIRLTWTNPNPYPTNYVVLGPNDETTTVVTNNSNTVDMPRKPFNSFLNSYEIYILPKSADPGQFMMYHEFYTDFKESRIPVSYFNEYYDNKTNLLYMLNFNEMHILDATKDFKLVKTVNLDESVYSTGAIVGTSNTGMVGIKDGYYNLSLYSNNTLGVRTAMISKIDDFNFGGNLLLTYANATNNSEQYTHQTNVYDAASAQLLFTIDGDTPLKQYASMLNADGKYMFHYSQDRWFKLYEIVNNQPVEKGRWDNANFLMPRFNPANANEIFFVYRDKFEVRDLATLQVKATQEGKLLNIDPATGNVLFHNGSIKKVTILNNTYTKVLANLTLDIETHYGDPVLYNNCIIRGEIYSDYRKLIEK